MSLSIEQLNQSSADIWQCFSDEEYNEDQHDIIEQIQQLKQQLTQSNAEIENLQTTQSSRNEQFKESLTKLIQRFVSYSDFVYNQELNETIRKLRPLVAFTYGMIDNLVCNIEHEIPVLDRCSWRRNNR